MAFALKDTDQGYRDLMKRALGLKAAAHIDVGILDGSEPHAGSSLTVLEIGLIHEFGNDHVPERSFIRAWFDEDEATLREDLVKLAQSVLEGKRTRDEILEILGQRAVGRIQDRIARGIEPPNAPSTIARKGSSTPLVDTGVLRSKISYRVAEGGAVEGAD